MYPEKESIHLSEKAEKIRRNIFIFSTLLMGLSVDSIEIPQDKPISLIGIPLEGLELDYILIFLLCTVGYLVLHFFWICKAEWGSWKFLLLGEVKVPGRPPDSSRLVSLSASNSLHLTADLYSWIDSKLTECCSDSAKDILAILKPDLDRIDRIESEYKKHLQLSGLRLVVMEAGVPLVLGVFSLAMGVSKVFLT